VETGAQQAEADRGAEDIARVEPQTPRVAPSAGQVLPFEILGSGQQSAVRIPLARSVTSPVVWEEIWFAIHANQLDPPPVPKVDFTEKTVVVLILGERRTGGYGVSVNAAISTRESITVEVSVREPEPDSMVTMALTSPFQLVAIPAVGRPVVFVGADVQAGYSPYD
jgi:hypothetical protein